MENALEKQIRLALPKKEGGTEIKSVQHQSMDSSHPGQNHWEGGRVKINDRTGEIRTNQYGAPKLMNGKSKVNYD